MKPVCAALCQKPLQWVSFFIFLISYSFVQVLYIIGAMCVMQCFRIVALFTGVASKNMAHFALAPCPRGSSAEECNGGCVFFVGLDTCLPQGGMLSFLSLLGPMRLVLVLGEET